MNILVLGSGAREHALVRRILVSNISSLQLFVLPGNAGTAQERGVINVNNISLSDVDQILQCCHEKKISMVVVGPELPLSLGIADALQKENILCFGPTKDAARLETSKRYGKEICESCGIPTAPWKRPAKAFKDEREALKFVVEFEEPPNVVIKLDGLAGGKGTFIPESKFELHKIMREIWQQKFLVEKRISGGHEFSAMAFCDSEHAICMPFIQDYKKLLNDDLGPNTGGMGAIGPATWIPRDIKRKVKYFLQSTIVQMKRARGVPYRGILYGGFMWIPHTSQLYLLEFNCRFGDPECQVAMHLLNSNLVDIMRACCNDTLGNEKIQWKKDTHVSCLVLADRGYPKHIQVNQKISNISPCLRMKGAFMNCSLYHGATKIDSCKLLTNGGRVLCLVSEKPTMRESIRYLYFALHKNLDEIHFDGEFPYFRTDIGELRDKEDNVHVAVLGSTRGTVLKMMLYAKSMGMFQEINFDMIISDHASAGILQQAKLYKVPHYVKENERGIYELLEKSQIDVVLLIGYMRKLSPYITDTFLCINIHPSLLPKYKRKMSLDDNFIHNSVLTKREKWTGCTAYIATQEMDGGLMLTQRIVPVKKNDTLESLKARVQYNEFLCFEEVLFHCKYEEIRDKMYPLTYEKNAGVSISSFNRNKMVEQIKKIYESTKTPQIYCRLGGFGGLSLSDKDKDHKGTTLVASVDGVGTKLSLASRSDELDFIGIDLVAMSVNDVLAQGAIPLAFLDYYLSKKLEQREIVKIISSIAEGCKLANVGLIGGEIAEEYTNSTSHLAGFAFGSIPINRCPLTPTFFTKNATILGIESSGCHSNGFSLIQKCLERANLSFGDRAPWDPERTVSGSLLTPTHIYVRCVKPWLEGGHILAMAHITGGGIYKNLDRVIQSPYRIKRGSWRVPDVFRWIQYVGQIEEDEMYRVFNMGIGMILVISPEMEKEIQKNLLEEHNFKSYIIGECV